MCDEFAGLDTTDLNNNLSISRASCGLLSQCSIVSYPKRQRVLSCPIAARRTKNAGIVFFKEKAFITSCVMQALCFMKGARSLPPGTNLSFRLNV